MAGSNQAINLGGMLNQIAGTIGEGYTINGKNAGAAIGDTFANLAKPELDPNDPNSLKEMADWASRNGRTQEAAQYTTEYMRQAKEQAALNAAKANSGFVQQGNKAAQGADYRGLSANIDKLRAAQANASTAAQYDAIGKQISSLEAKLEPTKQADTQKKAKQVEGLESWLDNNAENADIPDAVKERAAQQREMMLRDADVSKAYRSNRIADSQAALQENAAKESQRSEFVNAGFAKARAEGGETYDNFKKQAEAMGAGHLVQAKEEALVRHKATEASFQRTLDLIAKDADELKMSNSTSGLDMVASKVELSETESAELADIKKEAKRLDDQDAGDKSMAPKSERRQLAMRIKQLETSLNTRYDAAVEQSAAERKTARESITRLQENKAKLSQSIPQQRVEEEALRRWMTANGVKPEQFGTDPTGFGDYSDTDSIKAQALAQFGEEARAAIVAAEAKPIDDQIASLMTKLDGTGGGSAMDALLKALAGK